CRGQTAIGLGVYDRQSIHVRQVVQGNVEVHSLYRRDLRRQRSGLSSGSAVLSQFRQDDESLRTAEFALHPVLQLNDTVPFRKRILVILERVLIHVSSPSM